MGPDTSMARGDVRRVPLGAGFVLECLQLRKRWQHTFGIAVGVAVDLGEPTV